MKMGNATVNLVKSGQLLLQPTIIGWYLYVFVIFLFAELGNWICFFVGAPVVDGSAFLVGKPSLIGTLVSS